MSPVFTLFPAFCPNSNSQMTSFTLIILVTYTKPISCCLVLGLEFLVAVFVTPRSEDGLLLLLLFIRSLLYMAVFRA